ncbi:aromatic ring-hydroxylating dioxygenase subunit alpha [Nakamurella sp. PAMC28650]|uniref:aromatic ring-hydroxylating oxygenase subunit alpha n=1 Tax=Nakamurella sp. PAMC28650 TaxID=2762325 RepID=UPI00164E8E28|nr:aromatic ring-hydroxylating dioxygenase subunit alpha [Nakamurella sp. PAMC28650]QNK82489.1 aromatic ring-hydroxylating dioxygenase subunit alpha [Nakamurella sp. PAMC28650]
MTTTELPESLISTLPGHFYTDPQVFALEQARIFEDMWFCAIRASDVPTPGSFRTVQVGTESIIISRSRRGEIRAFFNICRHRGLRLCMEESGDVGRAFRCPYHAWTYDLDGKLIAAPNLTKMPDIDRQEYGLKKVHLREWLGYVWVSLADEPPSFEDTVLQEVVDRLGEVANLDHYQVESLSVGRRIVYDVKANWKLIIENFMECYHCATIHPELTEVLPEFADGYAAQAFVNHGADFADEVKGFTIDGSEGLEMLPGIDPDQDRKYYAITIKPQVFINMVPDHIIFHRMYPMAADRTVVECDWLYLPSVVEQGRDVTKSVELFDRVNRQDFDACERCQPAMSSRVYRDGGVLVPSEHHIGVFHDWLQDKIKV